MPTIDEQTMALVKLTLTPGLGPVLIGRAIRAFGSADGVMRASVAQLRQIPRVGEKTARQIRAGLHQADAAAERELALAERLGVRLLAIHDAAYPPLLRQIPDPPPLLYVRGRLLPDDADRYPIAVVGSRSCTHYGVEQAERFALSLAQHGLTVVSGGARGIDTAAHRGALRARGRTIAVLGCGLGHCYPPDNAPLFDSIAQSQGAVISELPLDTAPTAENFPARNRIISGLALGVLVVEAGRRSGALITARDAVEDHGREVFVLPGRVDSRASEGSLELIKSGSAALVTHPDDILRALEDPARHHFYGTHEARYADPSRAPDRIDTRPADDAGPEQAPRDAGLTAAQRTILRMLDQPRTLDELARTTGMAPAGLRADLTILEIHRRIRRCGSRVTRA